MTYAECYASEYLGKIFYYCLRKTGNENEAEELSSDITVAVMQELAKGVIPESFSAWVWKIAKNRYAGWADKKHKKNMLFDSEDIEEYIDIMDDDLNAKESLIYKESLSILRRELAFIRSDYRKVLVAFYIDDKSLPSIAKGLGLPLGTVKTRLIKAREILKEGMDMAREFGKLSYRPENISFVNYVPKPGRRNEPWSPLEKLLPKNILLAAYRNPMTAEELSLELGVALPYLEEEIAVLEKQLLLRKTGKKYESTIAIISEGAQRNIFNVLCKLAPAMEKKIEKYLALRDELYAKNGLRWNLGAQPEEDMRWARLMRATDVALWELASSDVDQRTKRPNGGEWDIVGYEEYHGDGFCSVGQHGTYESEAYFTQYKFCFRDIWKKTPEHMRGYLADALEAVCEGRDADLDSVKELCDMGYLKEEYDTYIPQMMVVDARYGDIGDKGLPEEDKKILSAVWDEVVDSARAIKEASKKVLLADVPASFMYDPIGGAIIADNVWETRGAVLEFAIGNGYISYEKDDHRCLLGTMITVNNDKSKFSL